MSETHKAGNNPPSEIDYSDPGSVSAIRARFKQTDYTRDIACPKNLSNKNVKPAPAAKPLNNPFNPKNNVSNKSNHNHSYSGNRLNHYIEVSKLSGKEGSISSKSNSSINSRSVKSGSQQISPHNINKINVNVQNTVQNSNETGHRYSSGGGQSISSVPVSDSNISNEGLGLNSNSNTNILTVISPTTLEQAHRNRLLSGTSSIDKNKVRQSVSDMFDSAIRTASCSQVPENLDITIQSSNQMSPTDHLGQGNNLFEKDRSFLSSGASSSSTTHHTQSSSILQTSTNVKKSSPLEYKPILMKKPIRHLSDSGFNSFCGSLVQNQEILGLIGECQEFLDSY